MLAWPSGPPTLFRRFCPSPGVREPLRNAIAADSTMTSNEFDTPFHREDVAICWSFSFAAPLFASAALSPRSRIISLGSLSLVIGRCCRFSLSLHSTVDYIRISFSPARGSPGPEVVMSASVARPVASRSIVANDDVTLEISRPVIQVVSLCTA